MTRYVNIELEGGPYDGRRLDSITVPFKAPHGTWLDGYHYTYTPTGRYTTAGRLVYRLTHVTPANGHPSMQGGEL